VAESLFNKSLHGFKWAFSQQLGSQLIRVSFSILLARILSPAEFGVVGLASVIYYFLLIVSRFGISEGLIQAGKLSTEKLAALFKLNLIFSVITAIIFFISADWVSGFYAEPQLKNVIRLLSLNFIFTAFIITPRARLEKELKFKVVTKLALPAISMACLMAVLAALSGWGVYSLVVMYLAENLFLAIGYLRHLPRAKAAPLSEIKSIIGYSWKMALAGTIGYIGKNMDTMLIAKWIGATDLGIYNFSYRLTRLPTQNFAAILDRVLFPAYSTISNDLQRVASAYCRALECVSRIIIPAMAVAIVILPPLVEVLLGDQWSPAIPVMQIFCLLAIIQSLGRGTSAVIQALGRSDVVLIWVFIVAPANILAVFLTARHGIIAVATGLVVIRTIIFLVQQFVIAKILKSSSIRLYLADAAGILPAILLGALLYLVVGIFSNAYSQLMIAGIILSLLSIICLRVFGREKIWSFLTDAKVKT
jgi:O-antigen/teichoic acid export membrane protein